MYFIVSIVVEDRNVATKVIETIVEVLEKIEMLQLPVDNLSLIMWFCAILHADDQRISTF